MERSYASHNTFSANWYSTLSLRCSVLKPPTNHPCSLKFPHPLFSSSFSRSCTVSLNSGHKLGTHPTHGCIFLCTSLSLLSTSFLSYTRCLPHKWWLPHSFLFLFRPWNTAPTLPKFLSDSPHSGGFTSAESHICKSGGNSAIGLHSL